MPEANGYIPPHDIAVERALLGAILLDNDLLLTVSEEIVPSDFYRQAHQEIYSAMLLLAEEKHAIDLVTLRTALGAKLDECGGPAYLASLVDGLPRSSNALSYARIIRQHSLRRQAIAIAEKMIQHATKNIDPVKLLDAATAKIASVSSTASTYRFVDLDATYQEQQPQLARARRHELSTVGIPMGFADLDLITNGLGKSDLILLAARPGMGKSAFCTNVAVNVARQEHRTVAFFSLEMSRHQLFYRILASEARVDFHKFRSGYASQAEFDRMDAVLPAMCRLGIYIDDSARITTRDMRARCLRLKSERGLDLVIVDYLQLVTAPRAESRTQEVSAISAGLKALAKDLDVPVLAVSQLSRAPETRMEGRPKLSDLRESGSLEQDADVVIFIHKSGPDDRVLEFIVAKQRQGPVGSCELAWLKEITRFETLAKHQDDEAWYDR
jgi:replicative DNA helicase